MSSGEIRCLVAFDGTNTRPPHYERLASGADSALRARELKSELLAAGWDKHIVMTVIEAADEKSLQKKLHLLSRPRFEAVVAIDPEGLIEPIVERVDSPLQAARRAQELREKLKAEGRDDVRVWTTYSDSEEKLEKRIADAIEQGPLEGR